MGTAAMAKALGRMEVRPSTKPVNPAGRKARKKRNVSRRRSDSKGSGSPHPGTGLRGEPARLWRNSRRAGRRSTREQAKSSRAARSSSQVKRMVPAKRPK